MSGTYYKPIKRIFLNLSGGTVTGDTTFTEGVYSTRLSGGTIFSGDTELETIIRSLIVSDTHTFVQPGRNVLTGGTSLVPIVNLVESPSFNNLILSGSANVNGTQYSGGTIVDDGVFVIDAASQLEIGSDLMPVTHLAHNIGAIGQRWNEVFLKTIKIGSSSVLSDGLFSSTTGDFTFDFSGDLYVNSDVHVPGISATTIQAGVLGDTGATIAAYGLITLDGVNVLAEYDIIDAGFY